MVLKRRTAFQRPWKETPSDSCSESESKLSDVVAGLFFPIPRTASILSRRLRIDRGSWTWEA